MNWIKEKIIILVVKKILAQEGVSKMFNAVIDFLRGKKTYLVGIVFILNAVITYLADGDLSKLIKSVLEGIGLMTVRAGISKA